MLFSHFAGRNKIMYTFVRGDRMIGERLQEIRKDHNDTQQSLADKLHATLFAVRCWEQNKSDPSHDTLVSICRLYDVSADYLLGLTDIDPAYTRRRRKLLSAENQAILHRFESFLLAEQQGKVSI